MNLSLLFLLLLGTAWFISRPHWIKMNEECESSNALHEERERLILELRELELDYGVGKLAHNDYQRFHGLLSAKLAIILSRLQGAAEKK